MPTQDKVQGWKLVETLTTEIKGLDLSPVLREELADRLELLAQYHREIARKKVREAGGVR